MQEYRKWENNWFFYLSSQPVKKKPLNKSKSKLLKILER